MSNTKGQGGTEDDGQQRMKKIEGKLVIRSRQILRAQANLLCHALQSLKRHSDAGLETAGQIWTSLLEGIIAEIPPDFFDEYAKYYFWQSGEVLTTDERAFRQLLEQAQTKLQQTELDEGKQKDDQTPRKEVASTSASKIEVTSTSGSGSLEDSGQEETSAAEERKDSERNDDIDELLTHLIGMLKMAAERTQPSIWEWKEGEGNLKLEVETFHNHLKVAMTLFAEIHNNAEIHNVIDAVEQFSSTEAIKMFRILNSNEPVSSEESACEYSEPEEDKEEKKDEEDSEREDESKRDDSDSSSCGPGCGCSMDEDSDSERESYEPPDIPPDDDGKEDDNKKDSRDDDKKQVKPADRDIKKKKTKKEYQKVAEKPETPRVVVKRVAPKMMEDISDGDSEGYIVRHTKYLKKRPASTTGVKSFQNPDCDHSGYIGFLTHYRDWKRDGFRCMCGIKFRFLNALDKHIFAHQEARMLSCDECDYKVGRNCCMDTHKRDYHEKPKLLRSCRRMYQCTYGCERVLKTKKELFDHQKDTERQCLYNNTLKVDIKFLPGTPEEFVTALNITCDRAGITLTVEHLEQILVAAEMDANRLLCDKILKNGMKADGYSSSDASDTDTDEESSDK